ncbi:MAG: hypothetical protein U5L02_06485 [Rheinheimera sp.]|nr:hypothetical protein [Rheinheimera sp.]
MLHWPTLAARQLRPWLGAARHQPALAQPGEACRAPALRLCQATSAARSRRLAPALPLRVRHRQPHLQPVRPQAQSAISASANLAGAAASGAGATLQAGAAPASTSLATPGLESLKVGAKLGLDTTAQSLVGQGVTSGATSGGLLGSFGDASKAALITGGINMGGQMGSEGYAQQRASGENMLQP